MTPARPHCWLVFWDGDVPAYADYVVSELMKIRARVRVSARVWV